MRLVPSILAHILNGILTFATVAFAFYHIDSLKRLEPFKAVVILLLFAIAIGVHSMSHLGLEKNLPV